uniref:(northern house mosquito) hypothetical protein n=1 Tax=Culex pipiens TaxID=7175 RepID=A0A8D8AWN3_CULPI
MRHVRGILLRQKTVRSVKVLDILHGRLLAVHPDFLQSRKQTAYERGIIIVLGEHHHVTSDKEHVQGTFAQLLLAAIVHVIANLFQLRVHPHPFVRIVWQ